VVAWLSTSRNRHEVRYGTPKQTVTGMGGAACHHPFPSTFHVSLMRRQGLPVCNRLAKLNGLPKIVLDLSSSKWADRNAPVDFRLVSQLELISVLGSPVHVLGMKVKQGKSIIWLFLEVNLSTIIQYEWKGLVGSFQLICLLISLKIAKLRSSPVLP